jgi:hypothetical protein
MRKSLDSLCVRMAHFGLGACLLAILLAVVSGCTPVRYQYAGNFHTEHDAPLKPGEAQIERGRPAPVLDTVGWVIGIPAKIIMLDRHVDNHDISPETETAIGEYLARNDLDRVKVRVNQYDPGGEWRRLVHNESVAWPLRYTVGTLSVVGYTVLPGRVFGGDGYNPFTNTISLYSDVPSLALYEGGYSKDYAQREYKGLYAVGHIVPGVGLWQDVQASGDAMRYIQENGMPQDVKAGYRSIYPSFALHATEPFSACTTAPIVLPALVVGHVSGQVRAACIDDTETSQKPVGPVAVGSEGAGTVTSSKMLDITPVSATGRESRLTSAKPVE